MTSDVKGFSVAVFPFLKTGKPAPLGPFTFRTTDDTEDLPRDQASSVAEIARMLFLQDDLRIKSASYTIMPRVDADAPSQNLNDLMRVREAVAYCYAGPRHEFGDLFLSPEQASIAVFTPNRVPTSLVRPEFHVEAVHLEPAADHNVGGSLDGYAGLYNFRHHFWAARGSRLYGPIPHINLIQAQDLSRDLTSAGDSRADYRLLLDMLRQPDGPAVTRVFNAVHWFNEANNKSSDEASALVNLAIAFEALLQIPRNDKTDRLIDAISLLLGRTQRLDTWARQFYDARSLIVHEGRADQLRFVAPRQPRGQSGSLYQSLVSYGRQVFQLCLGTVLTGAELADQSDLKEKFVTNQERFEQACKLLEDATLSADEKLDRLSAITSAIQTYCCVPETGLTLSAMLGACRLAARTWLESDASILGEGKKLLDRLASAARNDDHIHEMDALAAVLDLLRNGRLGTETDRSRGVRNLLEAVWVVYVGMHYYWLKERRSREDSQQKNRPN